ncbi:MAG: hypothetical protein WC341_16895 [Bacteroidales bacterium]|jgi:hypothetical protein
MKALSILNTIVLAVLLVSCQKNETPDTPDQTANDYYFYLPDSGDDSDLNLQSVITNGTSYLSLFGGFKSNGFPLPANALYFIDFESQDEFVLLYNEDNEPAYLYAVNAETGWKDPNVIGFEAIDPSSFYLRYYEYDWNALTGELISEVILQKTSEGFEIQESTKKSACVRPCSAEIMNDNLAKGCLGIKSGKNMAFDGTQLAVNMVRNFLKEDLKSSIKDYLTKTDKTLDLLPLPYPVKATGKAFVNGFSKIVETAMEDVDRAMFNDEENYSVEIGYESQIANYGTYFEGINGSLGEWSQRLLNGYDYVISSIAEIGTFVNLNLDGYWMSDGGTGIHIKGNSGFFYSLGGIWQEFANYGIIRLGDQKVRNISNIEPLKWNCQDLWWVMTNGVPDYVGWSNTGTITMNVGGDTIFLSSSFNLNGELFTEGGTLFRDHQTNKLEEVSMPLKTPGIFDKSIKPGSYAGI